MSIETAFSHCESYINSQLQSEGRTERIRRLGHRPLVTISRQTGTGGITIAEQLAARLQRQDPASERLWAVFDKNLVEKVLEDHHLPQRLARYMPEDAVSEASAVMEELLGLHPPITTLVRQTTETILNLAQLGSVIFMGRAANVITARFEKAVHVRLIGSLEKRLEYAQRYYNMGPKEAEDFILKTDEGRRRYLKKNFNKDIEDPHLYHLVLNMDWVGREEAVRMIADMVLRRSGAD